MKAVGTKKKQTKAYQENEKQIEKVNGKTNVTKIEN